jgi:hypothetical protein
MPLIGAADTPDVPKRPMLAAARIAITSERILFLRFGLRRRDEHTHLL